MAVNSIGDFIRSVFPTLVNKNGTTFKALLADGEGGGTVEKIFEDLEETRKAWTENKSIYSQSGEQLQKTLAVFSVISQLQNEREATFLKRNELLFYRNGDKIWGDKWNILNIFKTFFNNQNIYLVNNTEKFEDNLLEDGNFERQTAWTLEDSSYEREARFEETTGVLFNASGTCKQSVNVNTDTSYFLHFFLKGNIRVQIKDNNNRYWNPKGGEFGAWSSTEYSMHFESTDWDNKSFYFITDVNVASVQVIFLYEPGYYAFLDYVRLNEKTGASTFSLVAVFEGVYSDETANLAPGTNDDIVAFDYDTMGFHSPGGEDAPLEEDVSPIVSEGSNDIEPLNGYENMTYLDEQKALAPQSPVNSDDFKSVDYSKVSYFDSAYIFGATGKEVEEIYQALLDIVQPGGMTSTIEILVREQDD
jgi:hypothetical protein